MTSLKAKVRSDTLLMFSGGLDSTWCLWQRCKEGLPTRVHHVVLKDREGRQNEEVKATTDIMSYMRKQGWDHLITYSESKVDFGSLFVPYNYYLWAYWSGAIFAGDKRLKNVVIPRHSDAFEDGPDGPYAQASNSAYRTIIKEIAKREPNLLFPMIHLTKAEIVADLPEDLRSLAWYCRRPKAGTPCNQCRTCRMVNPALASVVK